MIFKNFGNIMNNLGDIRLFVEAANLGGLSAAGRKLGLSPAAASARLIKLESVLHTRLFERTRRHVLKDWLDQFNRQYPEVTFALLLSDSLSNLLQDDIDLVIRFGVPPDSTFVARPLAPNRRVLCASPRYLAKHGAPEHPRDLERFNCIVLSSAAGPANDWQFTRNG